MRQYAGTSFNPWDWRKLRFAPYYIPVGSQTAHATGWAWASRLRGERSATLVFFGDGAASQGEVHEAMNYAGVFDAPVVFLLENNGWAISLPTSQQTRATRLASRAEGYGIPGVTVDGNDVFAVREVVRNALDRARRGEGPTLVEAVTYRMGGHTTADDPGRYRAEEEVAPWRDKDPLDRFRLALGDEEEVVTSIAQIEQEVEDEMNVAVDEWLVERNRA
jgi:pyruvate dehydrogenase E1 component alpha subunit